MSARDREALADGLLIFLVILVGFGLLLGWFR